jgi:uncharacterized protein YndB with AHSA1/START domain
MTSSTDRIEKHLVLHHPRARVWRAITDVSEFNQWFGVSLTSPFAPGKAVSGHLTVAGYESLEMTVWVETIEPEQRFSFRWHPYAIDVEVDYSNEPTTVVTFTLEDVKEGTKLTVTETGFDALPESRRAKAFASNGAGWMQQLEQIQTYLSRG